jgi:predicted ATP-dependent endonuclease of OLD family
MYKGDDGKAFSRFSETLLREIVNLQKKHLNTKEGSPLKADVRLRREMLSSTINGLFSRHNTDYNYLITSRGLLASYPSLIGSKVRYELEKMIEDEVKQQDFEKKRRTGNEKLIFSFIEWSEAIMDYFRVNGGSFQSVGNTLENPIALQALITINEKILKGRYDVDSYGELIRINDNERVYVKDASSGQQEVLRVLQAIFLATGLRNRREFMVVEEPEAHLFPLAQRELMNAFAVFLNTIAEGKLIITTHSPYILACVNLLLLADYSIAQGVNTASLFIPELYHLEREHFSCYSLGHRDEYCKSIKDPETGLIDQNYLDTISEQLGDELSQMYDLLSQNV